MRSPSNPALLGLNVNGGQEVKLRLRRQNNEWDFFPYEQILDTMLHELCHNQFGPHNADFYNLLDEIRKECEGLMAKGITGSGQGFDLRGKRLGGYSRQPPLSSLRQKALSAAENRVQRGTLLPSGPKRLEELPETSKASASQELSSSEALPSKLASSHGEGEPKASWECGVCTLLNEALALTCEACGTQRIIEEKNAKKTNTNTKIWSCKFCTLQNSVATERCVACGEWKYSYGPPAATSVPYLGT
ncbi:DNA-dependent metalloprotease WSS1-like protein [Tanacetum coccineum]